MPGTALPGHGGGCGGMGSGRRIWEGTTRSLLQGRKCCEKQRKGLRKVEKKDRDGKKDVGGGGSHSLQGVDFLTER